MIGQRSGHRVRCCLTRDGWRRGRELVIAGNVVESDSEEADSETGEYIAVCATAENDGPCRQRYDKVKGGGEVREEAHLEVSCSLTWQF